VGNGCRRIAREKERLGLGRVGRKESVDYEVGGGERAEGR